MNLFQVGIKSLWSRRFTVALIMLTIGISTALLLGVERTRHSAKTSFVNTVSGVDLLVGARSGSIPLLLYSVFRIGNATNNISWPSYQEFANRPDVKWTIPFSLGDSHKGYRVLGTNTDYFEFYRLGQNRTLRFDQGRPFEGLFDVVIGAQVAKALGYGIGDSIVLAHGLGETSFSQHDDAPFNIVGILEPTGTPVDRTIHVSLEAIEAIHVGWEQGIKIPGARKLPSRMAESELEPKAITAFLLGLNSRIRVFKLQREINNYRQEPLLAVFPGVALQELWGFVSVAEKALWIVSIFVAIASFFGLIAVSLAGLNERRKEIAVFRAVGASYRYIISLLVVEAGAVTLLGIGFGLLLLTSTIALFQGVLESRFGLYIALTSLTGTEYKILIGFFFAGLLSGLVPAYIAYRNALIDGLCAKI